MVSKLSYKLFDWEFYVKMIPLILGGRNFLASNPFLQIFNAKNAPKEGLHLLFGHHKQ
jgi:hypothetical protein